MSDLLKQVKDLFGGGSSGQPTTSDSQAGGRRRRGTSTRKHHKKSVRKYHKKSGGKKHNKKSARKHRARRGGSVVATAALPFGILAVQKFFQTRKGRKDLKKMNKSVRSTSRRVRRSI